MANQYKNSVLDGGFFIFIVCLRNNAGEIICLSLMVSFAL